MLSYEEKVKRIELIDAVSDAGRLARGLNQLLESLAHADQLDPLDVEGPGPEVNKSEVRRAHRRRGAHPGGPERDSLRRGTNAEPHPLRKLRDAVRNENRSPISIRGLFCARLWVRLDISRPCIPNVALHHRVKLDALNLFGSVRPKLTLHHVPQAHRAPEGVLA